MTWIFLILNIALSCRAIVFSLVDFYYANIAQS